ncbi:MAG: S8 family serine peptidase, partial [bacterium]|nr:S8 family serine peptidase [bacterium]
MRRAVVVLLALAMLAAAASGVAAQTDGDDSSQSPDAGFDPSEGLGPATLGPDASLGPELGTQWTADAVVYPNLGSQLSAVAVAFDENDPNSSLSGEAMRSSVGGEPLLLTIQTDGASDGVVDFLARNGVSTANVVGDYLEAYVPPDLLAPLAGETGVERVREMPEPFRDRGLVKSAGVAKHAAVIWHRNGFTGEGVKVGVIDTSTTATAKDGFTGLRALQGTELPLSVTGRCYADAGRPTSNLANCDAVGGDRHGTMVAETLMDMAPDAELYVSNPITWADLHSAVVWMHGQGVQVIVYSVSWSWHGAADSTSPYNPSPLNTAKWAADNGIVWVNSAGNYGRMAWFGPFADADDDGYHEWTSGTDPAEAQSFYFRAGAYMYIALRWDDTWGGSTKDLDLEVRYSATRGGTQSVVGSSADPQSGGATHYPSEGARLRVLSGGDGYYSFYVKKKTASTAPSWLQVLILTDDVPHLPHYTSGGSVASPGDSSHAGVLAVGAASYSNTQVIRNYSSRGPTPDNRTKPDIVGVDCTQTVRRSFCGTSQSAPHVGGLAALVIDRNPTFTPQQVADYLKTNAAERGTTGADNTWGHGFALLPSAGLNLDDGCAVALTGAGSVQGAWGSDCLSERRSGRHARFYTFSLDSSASVRIDLESTEDAYMYLRRGLDQRSGGYLVLNDDGGDGRNSRIARSLAAGDYTIEATTFASGRSGDFTLTVAGIPDQSPVQATPEVSVTAGAGITEGGSASFTVSASPAPSAALSVAVTVSATGDFGAATGSRTVTVPTSGSATLTVSTTDDDVDETDGSVSVAVDAGSDYTVSATQGSASVDVADDDDPPQTPEVSVTAGAGITEGGSASFTVSASPAPSAALSVAVTVSATGDFGAATGSRTVTVPTSGSATLTVSTTDDDADETDGSVRVTVGAGSDYTVSANQGSASVNVADDDDPPPPVDGCVAALAGAGSVQGRWQSDCESLTRSLRYARFFTFSLGSSASVRIDLESSMDTYMYLRRGLDQRSGGYLVLNDDGGSGLNSRITRTLAAGDYTIEATTYGARRSGPFTLTVTGIPDQTTVQSLPVVSVAAGAGITEGGSASFTVSASPAPSAALSVSVAVSQSGDFGVSTGSRTVTVPTSGSVTLTVSTSDDDADETDGSVSVAVNAGSDYTVSPTQGSATVSVADDDDPPPQTPEVSVTAGTGITEGGVASFTVSASSAPSAPLSVSVTVSATGDFGAATGSRTVTVPTSGSATLTVSTTDDDADETDGSVRVTVGAGSDYTVSANQGSASVNVADDDDPPPPVDGCVAALAGAGSVQGRWQSDCESLTRSLRYARFFTFSLGSSASVRIDLESSMDTYMYLRRGLDQRSGGYLVLNDDGGSGLNSRITRTLAAGDYTIEATTYGARRSGPFTLTVTGIPDQTTVQSLPVVSVAAGAGITEGGSASFTVSASPAPSAALSVSVAVSQSGDFGVSTGSRTVTVPTSGSVTLTVSTSDDDADETDGSVSVAV